MIFLPCYFFSFLSIFSLFFLYTYFFIFFVFQSFLFIYLIIYFNFFLISIFFYLVDHNVLLPIFRVWSYALRSPSMTVKNLTFCTLADILIVIRHSISIISVENSGNNDNSDSNETVSILMLKENCKSNDNNNSNNSNNNTRNLIKKSTLLATLGECLALLPTDRLSAMGSKRLWYEMEDFPSYSRYIQVFLCDFYVILLCGVNVMFWSMR